MALPEEMYQCQTVNCGFIYDPDRGDRRGKIPKGTQFKDRRMTGNVRSLAPAKKCLNRWVD